MLSKILDEKTGIKQLGAIQKDSPKEAVDGIIRQGKSEAEAVAREANASLNDFRKTVLKVQNAGQLLPKLKEQTLAKLKSLTGDGEKKLRETLKSYLTPALQEKLEQSTDLSDFIGQVLGKDGSRYPEIAYAILRSSADGATTQHSESFARNSAAGRSIGATCCALSITARISAGVGI